ncbi:MAG: hypothetical protein HYY29_05660 [Chloroflexi bacterium]|nr:hypothetical protein [Chloroflexota bacterium]
MRNPAPALSVLSLFLLIALLGNAFFSAGTSRAADPSEIATALPLSPTPPSPSPTPTPHAGKPFLPLPLSADWEKMADSPEARVKASIALPGTTFEAGWGPLSRMGHTFIADVRIWGEGSKDGASSVYSKEYALGDVPMGRYLFMLRAWGKVVAAEIISFVSPNSATPTPEPSHTPKPSVTPHLSPIPPLASATGRLVKLQATTFMYGSHGLLRDGKLVLALRSETVNFDSFIDKVVVVWGRPVHSGIDGGPPLLNVLGIVLKPVPPTPTPTPTPKPGVTPTPTPTPRPTPVHKGAVVYVRPAMLAVGKSARLPVVIKNITAPAGLGAYDFKVTFDPAVIRVDEVSGGNAPFDSLAASSIDNGAGQVLFNAFNASIPGPTGDVIVAYLKVTATATTVSRSALNVTIVTLADADGAAIPAAARLTWVTVLPVKAVAAVRLAPAIGQDGRAVINVVADRVRDALTNAEMPPAQAIKRFSGQASFDSDRVQIVAVRGMGSFAGASSDIHNDAGALIVAGSQASGAGPGLVVLAQIVPKLTGSSVDSQIIDFSIDAMEDDSGNVAYDAPPGMAVRRGDAKADGKIDIADALFIAQYLAGLRAAGDGDNQTHVVNGASVRPDGDSGDQLSVTDALFIAQHLVGLRDASFQ